MGKSTVWLVALLAFAVLLAAAGAVRAQEPIVPRPIQPVPCTGLSIYDVNGDKKVDWADFETWVRRVHWGADACALNGPAANCPIWVDINGDGLISHADLDALHAFMMSCSGPPRFTQPIINP